MHERYDRVSQQATTVALAASALLVGLGVLGITPSILLAVGAAAIAGLLLAEREQLVGRADSAVLALHAETLWIGPAIAAAVLLLFGDLTGGELQTVGALIGLAGMANYLLRPLFLLLTATIDRYVGVV